MHCVIQDPSRSEHPGECTSDSTDAPDDPVQPWAARPTSVAIRLTLGRGAGANPACRTPADMTAATRSEMLCVSHCSDTPWRVMIPIGALHGLLA